MKVQVVIVEVMQVPSYQLRSWKCFDDSKIKKKNGKRKEGKEGRGGIKKKGEKSRKTSVLIIKVILSFASSLYRTLLKRVDICSIKKRNKK